MPEKVLSAFLRLSYFLDIEHQTHSLLFLFGIPLRKMEEKVRLVFREVDSNLQFDNLKDLWQIRKGTGMQITYNIYKIALIQINIESFTLIAVLVFSLFEL